MALQEVEDIDNASLKKGKKGLGIVYTCFMYFFILESRDIVKVYII